MFYVNLFGWLFPYHMFVCYKIILKLQIEKKSIKFFEYPIWPIEMNETFHLPEEKTDSIFKTPKLKKYF